VEGNCRMAEIKHGMKFQSWFDGGNLLDDMIR
jgi:hypothetical protein